MRAFWEPSASPLFTSNFGLQWYYLALALNVTTICDGITTCGVYLAGVFSAFGV